MLRDGRLLDSLPYAARGGCSSPRHDDTVVARSVRCCARRDSRGVPDADRVATTLEPVFEGYLFGCAEANAKGVTQVAPFVRPRFQQLARNAKQVSVPKLSWPGTSERPAPAFRRGPFSQV